MSNPTATQPAFHRAKLLDAARNELCHGIAAGDGETFWPVENVSDAVLEQFAGAIAPAYFEKAKEVMDKVRYFDGLYFVHVRSIYPCLAKSLHFHLTLESIAPPSPGRATPT